MGLLLYESWKFPVTGPLCTDAVVYPKSWVTHAFSVERKPVFNPVQIWKQAFRSYKRLHILRFYWSNTGLYTGILHRRFAGAIHRTNFPGGILWRYCYRKFHLVALGIYTDFGPRRVTSTFVFTRTPRIIAHAKRPQSNGIPNIQADALGAHLWSRCKMLSMYIDYAPNLPLSKIHRLRRPRSRQRKPAQRHWSFPMERCGRHYICLLL